MMTRQEWYDNVSDFILDNLVEFYEKFYKDAEIKQVGHNYRLEPCPACGHSNCATFSEIGVNCFSCKWSGTHIGAWQKYATSRGLTYHDTLKTLGDFTKIPFPTQNKEEIELYQKHMRRQDILKRAENFYNTQLMTCEKEYLFQNTLRLTPLAYLTDVRMRKIETIEALKIGFASNYIELRSGLINSGYTDEEIKESKVWIPDGLFVFFYHNPRTKEIMRYNTKNPFKVRAKNGEEEDLEPIEGFSSGEKVFLYSPSFSFKKPLILVEGEHDLASVMEAGYSNVACFGGRPKEETYQALANSESIIYTAFDNDDAGRDYLETVNRLFPEKQLRKIRIPDVFKDIDEFFVASLDSDAFNIQQLMQDAEPIATSSHKISHHGGTWVIENRTRKLEFIIKSRTEQGQLLGQINLYQDGQLVDREENKALNSCKANKKMFNFYLADAIYDHFNVNLEKRSFSDLAALYWHSSQKPLVVGLLAKIIHSDLSRQEDRITELKNALGSLRNKDDVIDTVLKEVNDLQNQAIVNLSVIRQMSISQFFDFKQNDGYMYFNYVKSDDGAIRRIPYMLRNDKTLIRLDLLKKKDEQCLLMVDNKYELLSEVPTVVIPMEYCSLQQRWVEEYISGKISGDEVAPWKLIRQIEDLIRRFYYMVDQSAYKVLALYTYGTYFYELFGQYPYLFVSGEKASGKSLLGYVLSKLCFNGESVLNITEAALFRLAGVIGGTIIMDEQENLTSRSKNASDGYAAVLKGGYARGSHVCRHDKESNTQEYFDPFCPKILLSIFGLDDIIADRCIEIQSYRLKVGKDNELEDPRLVFEGEAEAFRGLTSRCCISALEHFRTLGMIYRSGDISVDTESARLKQIVLPILAVARLVDTPERAQKKQAFPELDDRTLVGEYEAALASFYNSTISASRKETELGTPEGIIKATVIAVAKELTGHVAPEEINYIDSENHKYKGRIVHNLNEDWFELDQMHFKVFLEEHMPGEAIYPKILARWIKTCFQFSDKDIRRRRVVVEGEDMIREFKGNRTSRVNSYRFHFSDFVDLDFVKTTIRPGKITIDEANKHLF